jgi:phage shock protein E
MIDFLKGLFGPKVDIKELINNGAVIIDVRSKEEFSRGHVKSSINIPLDKLGNNLNKIDKNKPVITCCASGSRSAMAKNILKSGGFENVHNGGSWVSVNRYVKA